MANGLSPAGMQLFSSVAPGAAPGLGDLLRNQTQDETDELRKKRLQQMQQMGGSPVAAGTRAAIASPLGQYLGLGSVYTSR